MLFRFVIPKFYCYFTRFKKMGLLLLLPSWAAEPLRTTIQAMEDFIPELLQCPPFLTSTLLSFFKQLNI